MINLDELKAPENRGQLGLAILRIGTGLMFLTASWGKVTRDGGFGDSMVRFLGFQENMPDWYRSFIDSVIVPNSDLFGFLVAYGEFALAIALITGVMVRYAAIGGLFFVANAMLSKGGTFWVPTNHDVLYFFILVSFALNSGGGRILGLHDTVKRYIPKLPG